MRHCLRKKNNNFKISGCLIAVGLLIWASYSYFNISEQAVNASPRVKPEIVAESAGNITEYLPESEGEIVHHTYFTLSFSPAHKQAYWVYYSPKLSKESGRVKRTENFREDKKVPSGSARPSDYSKSGYDRGHLCPAGDMTQSIEAMSETFYMSNMCPQVPAFNRGIWKSLEDKVREWGKQELIYVVTGPVFRDNKGKIGKTGVTVPGYYYKVIYAPEQQQMIGFILPNEKSHKKWTDFTVSIDSVESFTGINFFPQLPDSLETRLEATADWKKWN